MGTDAPQNPVMVNIGCGDNKLDGWINVDAFGKPDVKHDLNVAPWPFASESVDQIAAWHIFEHLADWWVAFEECARILKPGGTVEIRVPDESSASALAYRDHHHVITPISFFGTETYTGFGTNAWAMEQNILPMRLVNYAQVPFREYQWMIHCEWLLRFCAKHLRNFIWEQRFLFQKTRSTQR